MSYLNLSRYFEGELRPRVAVSGHFILRRIHESGAVLQELAFDNLITNIGLDRIGYAGEDGNWQNLINSVRAGTGTAPPSVSDIELGNQVAATSTVVSGSSILLSDQTADRYSSYSVTRRFPFGTFSGTNLSEVGVGWTGINPPGISGSLFSRQLILDGSGSPTTVTVLSNEALDVTYEVRLYPVLNEFSGSLSFSGGGTYAYRGKAAGFATGWVVNLESNIGKQTQAACLYYGSSTAGATATYPADLNTSEGIPVGVGGSLIQYYTNSVGSVPTYVKGSYTCASSTSLGTSVANFASGICAMQLRNDISQGGYRSPLQSYWTILMDDKIPKTSLNTMQVLVSQSWGRR